MSNREEIQRLQKAIKDSKHIIQRQNNEISMLKEKCDALDSVIKDKNRAIGRLRYRVTKLQKMVGETDGNM